MCIIAMPGARGGQKRVSDLQELELEGPGKARTSM